MTVSKAEMGNKEILNDTETGLKESEAALQLQRHGYIELPSTQGRRSHMRSDNAG